MLDKFFLSLLVFYAPAWSLSLRTGRIGSAKPRTRTVGTAVRMVAPPPEPPLGVCDLTGQVPLTGVTLQAALKMRCDLTGAGYAIYWANIRDELVPVREHVTSERRKELAMLGLEKSFAEASMSYVWDPQGESLVAQVKRTGKPMFVANAIIEPSPSWQRRELATTYGIASVVFEPYEDGVIEFGTSNGPCVESISAHTSPTPSESAAPC